MRTFLAIPVLVIALFGSTAETASAQRYGRHHGGRHVVRFQHGYRYSHPTYTHVRYGHPAYRHPTYTHYSYRHPVYRHVYRGRYGYHRPYRSSRYGYCR